MSSAVPPPTSVPPSPATPENPAFGFEKTWRKIAAELQWGLVLGAVLGFLALGCLSAGFTWWPVQTNRLIGKIYPHLPWQTGMGWIGYALAGGLLVAGLGWGIVWRRRFRRRFQRTFKL